MTALATSFMGGLSTPSGGYAGGIQAASLRKQLIGTIEHLHSANARHSGVFNDFESLARENGLSARNTPVFIQGRRFLLALPAFLDTPELDIDNDGDLIFDWLGKHGEMMTVALSGNGLLHYACRYSALKSVNGKELFNEEIPSDVIQLVHAITR